MTNLPAGCTYDSGGRQVACTTGPLDTGATSGRNFRAHLHLLTAGPAEATATRTAGTEDDPNPANDTATTSCTILTSLIIQC